jgi:Fe-S-cluster containining protein
MSDPLVSEPPHTVAAGPFAEWLNDARLVLLGEHGSNVPCGDCVGCCTSSYFIPIRHHDAAALAHIPEQFLVMAPGQPAGHRMMGYLDNGACPMLADGKCSIYQHRPQTCRDYDCRIFAAAGIDAGGADKSVINSRVRAWRFTYPTDADRRLHDAVKAAASFIREHRADFPGSRAPTAPTGIAVLAIKVYALFLDPQLAERSNADIALSIIKASGDFDAAA